MSEALDHQGHPFLAIVAVAGRMGVSRISEMLDVEVRE